MNVYEEYSEWIMQQPEAQVCSGDDLVRRLEACWGWEDFCRQHDIDPETDPQ